MQKIISLISWQWKWVLSCPSLLCSSWAKQKVLCSAIFLAQFPKFLKILSIIGKCRNTIGLVNVFCVIKHGADAAGVVERIVWLEKHFSRNREVSGTEKQQLTGGWLSGVAVRTRVHSSLLRLDSRFWLLSKLCLTLPKSCSTHWASISSSAKWVISSANIFFKMGMTGSKEIAQWAKCLMCKHRDLNSIPKPAGKKSGEAVSACKPSWVSGDSQHAG